MPDETRTPQKDPPEGSREVIERELKRQEEKKSDERSPSRETSQKER